MTPDHVSLPTAPTGARAAADVLVLFDIDGTLVHTGRAGVRGLNAAMAELYGHDNALDGISLAGRTDRAIITDIFRAHSLSHDPDALAIVRDAYLRHLAIEIERPVTDPKCVLPGVHDAIDAFAAHPRVAVGLLTGNFERGAEIKLGYFDLWRRFDFGAFGDEHTDRRALVPLALSRAESLGHRPASPRHVIVIGDTPLDVDCAHANGALAIAVATGPFDRAALAAVNADVVVDTLEDIDAMMMLLNR